MEFSKSTELGLEDYPIEEALQAINHFTVRQEGEPQMLTFGDDIGHYAWLAVGEDNYKLAGHSFAIPHRDPVLISRYATLEEMAVGLTEKAKIDDELFRERVEMLTEQGVLYEHDYGPGPLPRTTDEELAIEEFEAGCLSIDDIKEAARNSIRERPAEDIPVLIITNAETGESHTLVLDATKLIAEGQLYITRDRKDGYRTGDSTLNTYIELSEYMSRSLGELGLDKNDVAVFHKKGRREELDTAHPLFTIMPREVSVDFWSATGEYTPASATPSGDGQAPPRHSLLDGLNYRRVDDYDGLAFLNAAQNMINHQAEFLRDFCGEELLLQPLRPLSQSFVDLHRTVTNYGFELGYSYACTMEPTPQFMLVDETTRPIKYLSPIFSSGDTRITLENSAREFERLRRPLSQKIGDLIGDRFRRG